MIEILTIVLRPGMREHFHQLYISKSLPIQKKWGIKVISHGPSYHDEVSYYVARHFANNEAREEQTAKFYASDDWQKGPRLEILGCIETISTLVIPDEKLIEWAYFIHQPVSPDGTISNWYVRNANPGEFQQIGQLMVRVYSQLEGFPKENEQPNYYKMLANVGDLTTQPATELLVAVDSNGAIGGAVVFFSDMKYYGSGGSATKEVNAAGFRLLAVDPNTRGQGIGKLLTNACIQKAKETGVGQLIIHTTMAMQTAWKMYEGLGFHRSQDLDFMQGSLPVFGFRLSL